VDVKLDEAQRQVLVMACAHLAVERPGWDYMLRGFVTDVLKAGPMYEQFHQLRMRNLELPREGDSILDVRRRVEESNPMLWAMVAELCWPGGRKG
jgi:hypothetical protein